MGSDWGTFSLFQPSLSPLLPVQLVLTSLHQQRRCIVRRGHQEADRRYSSPAHTRRRPQKGSLRRRGRERRRRQGQLGRLGRLGRRRQGQGQEAGGRRRVHEKQGFGQAKDCRTGAGRGPQGRRGRATGASASRLGSLGDTGERKADHLQRVARDDRDEKTTRLRCEQRHGQRSSRPTWTMQPTSLAAPASTVRSRRCCWSLQVFPESSLTHIIYSRLRQTTRWT